MSTVEEGGTITRPKPVSLREYAERWLDAQAGTVRPSTLDSYRSHWRTHLEPALGRRKVAQVTTADVRALIAELREAGRARATVRRVLQVLSLMYADAVEERAALSNPVAALSKRDRRAIRPDRTEARRFPVLDREQVAALIAETPEQYRLLLATAVITGLRKGELLGLRWCDLARDAQGEPVLCVRRKLDRKRKGETEATLSTPKTVAGVRDVAIPPALARALAAHRLASRFSGDEDYVFASSVGTPLHERNLLRRALDPAQEAAKLSERLRWHDLRHVAASALIADGASVIYVSRQLGHASASITLDVYGTCSMRRRTRVHTGQRRAAVRGGSLVIAPCCPRCGETEGVWLVLRDPAEPATEEKPPPRETFGQWALCERCGNEWPVEDEGRAD